MRLTIATGVLAVLLLAAVPKGAGALEVSTRPGDAMLGGSIGFSAVRLDKDTDRIQSLQAALRGAYFVSERWALGAGVFVDHVNREDINITTERYLAELLLVPIPDANVSPFLRVGGGYSRWTWEPDPVDPVRSDALTAEGAVGFFAFINEYFAISVDATYFYDQYQDNPDNEDDHNVSATIGFVGFLR